MTDIQLSFAPGTTLEMMVTYEMAARIWENYLGDNATVHLYVGMSNQLPSDVAGGALMGYSAYQQYGAIHDSLVNDQISNDDTAATSNLSTNSYHTVRIRGKNHTETPSTSELKLTRANAKAIGMVGGAQTKLDGLILMNDLSAHTNVSWDYDAVNAEVGSDQIDALSVALHEIGHTLGFVSGIDISPLLTATINLESTPGNLSSKYGYDILVDNLPQLTPLDLFRYSSQTKGTMMTELTPGATQYLSIDNGNTKLGNFAKGVSVDGAQASHWKNSGNPLGIMDPDIDLGERMTISDLDLLTFDVIGWDRQSALIDLEMLQTDAQAHLANQLQTSVTEMLADPTTAAENLTIDRSYDIAEMVYESQIYESLWGGNDTSWSSIEDVYYSLWGGNDTSWQQFLSNISTMMSLTGAFLSFEEGRTESLWGKDDPSWGGTTSVDKVDSSDSSVLTGSGLFDLTNEAVFGPAGEVVTAQLASAVTSDAGYNNVVGFYTVVDEAGGIDTDDDGIADVNPGDDRYTQAALTNAEDALLTRGQTGSIEFTAGEFVVPFLLANGGDLNQIPAALPEGVQAYFPDLAANADGAEHFRVSDKTLGIEDLSGGGDQDFNDFLFQLDFV
ncbi:MAG: DUF4114 domain-containing protein [Cyanobacteria bacterium]|jgi:hypothetical protein|nr:DUF4114 domain-containing protein [Cyanobacteria bacterium GSL.Bin1]